MSYTLKQNIKKSLLEIIIKPPTHENKIRTKNSALNFEILFTKRIDITTTMVNNSIKNDLTKEIIGLLPVLIAKS